jgi:hypothetical protein
MKHRSSSGTLASQAMLRLGISGIFFSHTGRMPASAPNAKSQVFPQAIAMKNMILLNKHSIKRRVAHEPAPP